MLQDTRHTYEIHMFDFLNEKRSLTIILQKILERTSEANKEEDYKIRRNLEKKI